MLSACSPYRRYVVWPNAATFASGVRVCRAERRALLRCVSHARIVERGGGGGGGHRRAPRVSIALTPELSCCAAVSWGAATASGVRLCVAKKKKKKKNPYLPHAAVTSNRCEASRQCDLARGSRCRIVPRSWSECLRVNSGRPAGNVGRSVICSIRQLHVLLADLCYTGRRHAVADVCVRGLATSLVSHSYTHVAESLRIVSENFVFGDSLATS